MAEKTLQVGMVGCGHWGPNYLRILPAVEDVSIRYAMDVDARKFERLRELYPRVQFTTDLDLILNDAAVNAVIICTPSSSHYELTKRALAAGKHVLTEKPLALRLDEAEELCRLAAEKKRVLMVGHVFLFNPGIKKLKELIETGEVGRIYYVTATRTHLGLIREDVNVLWDLAPHDISIVNYLVGSSPIYIDAVGACQLRKGREDAVFINLVYPDDVIAHVHVSWADSNKERSVKLVGSKARVVFNDLDNLERVKIYKKGIGVSEDYNDFGEFQLRLRDGDIVSPKLDTVEPLREMAAHFIDCIRHGKTPLTDGRHACDVIGVIESIQKLMKSHHG